MHIKTEAAERHTLAVIVDNEPGILARIAGLFTARGYNIESLTVSEVTADKRVSRITIVTSASPAILEQIVAQLDRLVPVQAARDVARRHPAWRYVELDGVGHVPQLQCPERLADEVLPWLAELDALRAGA